MNDMTEKLEGNISLLLLGQSRVEGKLDNLVSESQRQTALLATSQAHGLNVEASMKGIETNTATLTKLVADDKVSREKFQQDLVSGILSCVRWGTGCIVAILLIAVLSFFKQEAALETDKIKAYIKGNYGREAERGETSIEQDRQAGSRPQKRKPAKPSKPSEK